MNEVMNDTIKQQVREDYAKIAVSGGDCGCGTECCGPVEFSAADQMSKAIGYSDEDLSTVPEGANLGLGCGNPQTIASLKPGETVIDLGAGAGFDCFLAANAVGSEGRVIGVDMTPDMVSKARKNAENSGASNVEFRLGEIESLPVADNSADVIMSNCVINLSPDKGSVYSEAFRVLKPGGRLAISDVLAKQEIPESMKNDRKLFSGCISGASQISEVETMLNAVGFTNLKITPKYLDENMLNDWAPWIKNLAKYIVSANIEAEKPGVK